VSETRVRLDGWKAIAEHLGRTVRTVQRWHSDRDLPVHRVAGGKVGAVYACADELDAWLRQQPASLNGDNGATVERAPGSVAEGAPPFAKPRIALGRGVRWAIPAVAVLAAIGVATPRLLRLSPVPARTEIRGNELIVRDEADRLLWSFTFPYRLRPAAIAGFREYDARKEDTAVVDLDGDGRHEVIAVVATDADSQPEDGVYDIYCFEPDGTRRWRYRQSDSLQFNGLTYGGPWKISSWILGHDARTRGVWVAFTDPLWWPSFVVRLDSKGNATRKFVSSGVVYRLHEMHSANGPVIVAAGVNNEYLAAMVALLDPDQPPCSSPQFPGRYRCDGCPSPGPARFYLLPPTELAVLRGHPYNKVNAVNSLPDGLRIWAVKDEPPAAQLIYHMRLTLDIDSVSRADGYTALHRQLERSGVIRHPVDACPELQGMKVRMWEPKTGWSDLVVPMAK